MPFSYFWCSDFAFSSAFRYDAKLCRGHVCSTREGVVTFAALPNAYALAFHFNEAALGASVFGFESRYDFYVAFADCGTVAGS